MAADRSGNRAQAGKPEGPSKKIRTDPSNAEPNVDSKEEELEEGSETRPRRSVRRSEYESYYRDF